VTRRRAPAPAVWLGAGALLVGAVLAGVGVSSSPAARIAQQLSQDRARARAEVAPAAAPGGAPRPAPGAPSTATRASSGPLAAPPPACGAPRCVQIPALGVDAPVLPEAPVGGELSIPPDVHDVGWDEQTAVPGQPGVALLAGHVNWVGQGLGALGGIGQLVPGDLVRLDWGGRVTTWVVSARPQLSPNTEVHPQLFLLSGPPRLALVTCGGPFTETPAGGSYADNVIVWAVPAA